MISVERLRELFELKDDGTLVRRVMCGGQKAGTVAGAKHSQGYVQVGVDGVNTYAHKIVFAMVNGFWPELDIDHIDGNRSNNRPSNLRLATRRENLTNMRNGRPNKTGYRGVCRHINGLFNARMKIGAKVMSLGYYKTSREAAEVYVLESLEHHGEFSPFWSRTA